MNVSTKASDASSVGAVKAEVLALIASHTGAAPDPEQTLCGELGFDSLGFIELLVEMETRLDVRISDAVASTIGTVADLIEAVHEAKSGAPADRGIAELRDEVFARVPQLRVEVERQEGRDLLVDGRWVADFASANYLGLDLHPHVIASVQPAIEKWGVHPSWTRIVASPAIYGELERKLAEFVSAPDVLVFPTVTLAHAGLLPLLAGHDGTIFVDREAHASVHDAAALASARGATVVTYDHGDHAQLQALLAAASPNGAKIIATDGVFSMSSEYEDLPALAALAKRYDARVYVDDAHGIGLVGESPCPEDPYGAGNGLARRCGLDYTADRIIYVAGMSKAFSSLAAFVTCTDMAEKARFATAGTAVFGGPCPTASLASAIAGLEVAQAEGPAIRRRLHALTTTLVDGARALGFTVDNHEGFPLVAVVAGNTAKTITACEILWRHGILITPGIFPAAPHDRGLLRFTLTAANTEAQVGRALDALADVREALTDQKIQEAA